MNTDDWVQDDTGDNYKVARRICRGCPIREQCLKYAIDNGEEFGMWGGKTPRERERIRVNGQQ